MRSGILVDILVYTVDTSFAGSRCDTRDKSRTFSNHSATSNQSPMCQCLPVLAGVGGAHIYIQLASAKLYSVYLP